MYAAIDESCGGVRKRKRRPLAYGLSFTRNPDHLRLEVDEHGKFGFDKVRDGTIQVPDDTLTQYVVFTNSQAREAGSTANRLVIASVTLCNAFASEGKIEALLIDGGIDERRITVIQDCIEERSGWSPVIVDYEKADRAYRLMNLADGLTFDFAKLHGEGRLNGEHRGLVHQPDLELVVPKLVNAGLRKSRV